MQVSLSVLKTGLTANAPTQTVSTLVGTIATEGWLALQAHYDTEIVRERLGDVLSNISRYDRIAHPPIIGH